MTSAKNFKVLMDKVNADPKRRSNVERQYRTAVVEEATYRLNELRKHRNLTQVELAEILGIDQSTLSRIEGREDVLLSTLQDYIEALGGTIEVHAVFPKGDRIPVTLDRAS